MRICKGFWLGGAALAAAAVIGACTNSAHAQCVDDGRILSPCESILNAPHCQGDVDGDNDVDAGDCTAVTAHIGSTNAEDLCRYDLDCNGMIDADDNTFCTGIPGGACGSTAPCYITSMPFRVTGGQVSMAGATLFVDFFRSAASTNDWNDVDGDGFAGYNAGGPPFVDNLATRFLTSPGFHLNTHWMFQYRSLGSVNGFNEFVDSQLCHTLNTAIPSEGGIFNQFEYATAGVRNWGGPYGNASGTPYAPCGIDAAVLDVPSIWAVQVAGTPKWLRQPGEDGYGLNPVLSSTGYVSQLQSLSRDCGSGTVSIDVDDLHDFPAAWVPIAYIANRGTGLVDVKYSQMQHLFVSGRMPNGENLVGATRSVGSGTRNGIMNSTGIDTSFGRGDNVGNEVTTTPPFDLGPAHQPTNAGGSGQEEETVQVRRLAVGYTGLCGASRAASDAQSGNYEVLNVCKDVIRACVGGSNDGQSLAIASDCPAGKCDYIPGCDCSVPHACPEGPIDPTTGLPKDTARPNTGYVRPAISNIIDNCDACCGFQLGGLESFVTVGNPNANREVGDPGFESGLAVSNQAVADYLNNLKDSINEFNGGAFGGRCESSFSCAVSKTCQGGGNDGLACTTDAFCDTDPAVGIQFFCRPKPCTGNPAACTGGASDTCGVTACAIDDQCRDPGDFCRQPLNMPGQFMAVTYTVPAGVDCTNSVESGVEFTPTNPINQVLQEYIRANNFSCNPPAFGTINPAGKVPTRVTLTGGAKYSDGRTDTQYLYWNGASYVTLTSAQRLAKRNRIQGDADGNFVRDINDATELVKAMYTPRAWQQTAVATGTGVGSDLGNETRDNAIPEVMFDFNGDGSLTKEDLRYFADGLAMVGGALDRRQGAIAVDNEIVALAKPYPWAYSTDSHLIPAAAPGSEPTFNVPPSIATFLATGATYQPGDFRGDIAGNASRAPVPGANPVGYDGRVDAKDIDYVCRNIGDWSDLNAAVYMDLSADMDGDLDVDSDDVHELVVTILETNFGDADLDGDVDAADAAIVAGAHACNATMTCGWADGDFNCDRVVNAADAAVFSGACCYGTACTDGTATSCGAFACNHHSYYATPPYNGCFGDADGNGVVNAGDRGFVSANIGQELNPDLALRAERVCKYDMDGNGVINAGDRGFISANINLCVALPDYQNGSGQNHGVPDLRFPGFVGSFQGLGTSCATVTCP